MPVDQIQVSKFLSFVLRHKPDEIGLTLGAEGWANIDELIEKANTAGTTFDRADLLGVVASSDKKRFSLSADGLKIRAAQGHSVSVDLGLPSQEPPSILYHGTAMQFVEAILSEGLKPQARQQVHLSSDEETALQVGRRHGKPLVFRIDTAAMRGRGHKFYRADNGVWLTDMVPPEFLAPITTE